MIATGPEGVEADVDAAVAAAREAFDHSGWPQMEAKDRAAIMLRFMGALAARAQQIAESVSLQNGMPISLSTMLEASMPLGLLQYYAELGQRASPARCPSVAEGQGGIG